MSGTRAREMLDRMWRVYSDRFGREGYKLFIIGVPLARGQDIEAALDADPQDLRELLRAFLEATEESHGEEPKATTEAPRPAQEAGQQLGQGHHTSGPAQEPADEAPAKSKGDAASRAMELMGTEPVFEILPEGFPGESSIRLWASGKTQGLEPGVAIINHIPIMVCRIWKAAVEQSQQEVERLRASLRRCRRGTEPVEIAPGEVLGLYLEPNTSDIPETDEEWFKRAKPRKVYEHILCSEVTCPTPARCRNIGGCMRPAKKEAP